MFNSQNNLSQNEHFAFQIEIMDRMFNSLNDRKIFVAGDCNLDDSKCFATDYRFKYLFELQNTLNNKHHLMQIIDFPNGKELSTMYQKNQL